MVMVVMLMLGLMIARADGAVDTLDQLTHPFANFAFCICPRIYTWNLYLYLNLYILNRYIRPSKRWSS